jgi:hypothetical protein
MANHSPPDSVVRARLRLRRGASWAGGGFVAAGCFLAAPAAAQSTASQDAAPASQEGSPDAGVAPPPPDTGYLPGERRALGVGLSPQAAEVPALPGGLTTAPGGPAPADDWRFNFRGFMSTALRVSTGSRANPTADQSSLTLHTLPRVVDSYGMFSGTNSPQGSWVDMTFDYGNKTVTAHVKLTTWKPSDGLDWTAVGSQNFVDEAYLSYEAVQTAKLRVHWTAGAFRNIYGGLGQYSVGQYNAQIIGMPFGVGETLTAQYDITDKLTLHLEDGLMGRTGKVPAGVVPTREDNAANPEIPSSWVHHLHAGLASRGEIPVIVALHYISNWAQDERDQLPANGATMYWINGGRRPDPRMNIYGADVRIMDTWFGNFAAAVSYVDAKYAELLTGVNFFGSYTGEQMTKRFFGPIGGGTAKMGVGGVEYSVGWGRLLRHGAFTGDAPELTTSVFADGAFINSEDPDANGKVLVKFGSEVTYRFFSWLAASFRADYVAPNSKDQRESFEVISPKLIFKSDWLSHEQVTLAYTRWFYGADTHAEFPDDLTRNQLDNQMFALTFGMWF